MSRSYFITGTGTGVGKTFVTAGLARAARDNGDEVGVMKPVETGCNEEGGILVPRDAVALKEASLSPTPLDTINPYRFALPLAPYLAARAAGTKIDPALIKARYGGIAASHDFTLVEGAGGLLVPITQDMVMADLAALLGLPLLIVAASRLGVINHAALTAECAARRGLEVAGIILNNTTEPGTPGMELNMAEIERVTGVAVLAEIPFSGGMKKDAPFREGGVFEKLYNSIL